MIYYVSNQLRVMDDESPGFKLSTVEESLEFLETLQVVGFDTETQGLQIWGGKLLLAQLGNAEHQVVIDCTTVDIKRYRSYFESDRLFIAHNAKFDIRWLYKEGITINRVYDTYLAERILYLGYPPGMIPMTLKALCEKYFGISLDKSIRGQIYKGVTGKVIKYAADDVVWLQSLMQEQLIEITKRNQRAALDIENEAVRLLAYIEYSGIRLDEDKWRKKMDNDAYTLKRSIEGLDKWVVDYVMHEYYHGRLVDNVVENYYTDKSIEQSRKKAKPGKFVGIPAPTLFPEYATGPICLIDWGSPVKLIPLFNMLGFDLWTKDKKTKRKKQSVEAKIIGSQESVSSIVPLYLEYISAFKEVTSFGQNYLDAINVNTGRIHPTFNQLLDTGRISCGSGGKSKGGKSKDDDGSDTTDSVLGDNVNSVNIQQVPNTDAARSPFVPESGYVLIDCDYGDQEGKIFAELSGDKKWIEFYNDPRKRDGHAFVAKMCFPDQLADIREEDVAKLRPDLRSLSKKAKFCFNYNGSATTMAKSCNIDTSLAMEVYNNYFTMFNGIAEYFKSQKKKMWDNGYILISDKTGLRAHIYDWDTLKAMERRIAGMEDIWDKYRELRDSDKVITDIPPIVLQEIITAFANGAPIKDIATTYSYEVKRSDRKEIRYITINEETVYVVVPSHFLSRRSASENQSCNYSSQGGMRVCALFKSLKFGES